MINIFQPSLGKEEIDAIKKVFESNWIGKGEWVSQFEKCFAQHLNSNPENFISTTCCTEGIFLSSELFNFNVNDEIIVPSISFIAVGNSVVSKKAKVVFCDVDKRSLNTTAEHIEKK